MKNNLHQLVQDTLAYIKEEKVILCKTKPSYSSVPKEAVCKPDLPPPPSPSFSMPLVKEPLPLFFDKIQKHLPMLTLLKTIPIKRQVALLFSKKEDLPFLKNLAKAIQERFCPAVVIDKNQSIDLSKFILVLAQEEVLVKNRIILAPIPIYQNNTQEKKLLWAEICRHLSQK